MHLDYGTLAEVRHLGLPLGCQPRNPHQVVRRPHQLPTQSGPLQPQVSTPTEPSSVLNPSEDRLHPLAHLLARLVWFVRLSPTTVSSEQRAVWRELVSNVVEITFQDMS